MNYLELVNRAIQEAGKDQDDLTAGNFASPPSVRMYTRFKNWVNDAYKELQIRSNEWEFKNSLASVFIYPAIYVEQGNRAVAPPVGTLLRGDDTDFILEVQQVITHSGTWAGGTAKATIYFTISEDLNTSADFKFNEQFDEIDSDLNVLDQDVFRSKGWGRFDFLADGQVSDLWRVSEETFMIQSTGGSSIQDNDNGLGLDYLRYVDWDFWQDSLNGWAGGRGKPIYVTRAPTGGYEFWPRPSKQYVVNFAYTKAESDLSTYDSTPSDLPTRYHMAIVWLAVRKCGMYERDRQLVALADENLKPYMNGLMRDLMPDMSFGRSVYNHE
jgi:hypothetical protein